MAIRRVYRDTELKAFYFKGEGLKFYIKPFRGLKEGDTLEVTVSCGQAAALADFIWKGKRYHVGACY